MNKRDSEPGGNGSASGPGPASPNVDASPGRQYPQMDKIRLQAFLQPHKRLKRASSGCELQLPLAKRLTTTDSLGWQGSCTKLAGLRPVRIARAKIHC
jgi:hypothetical protein